MSKVTTPNGAEFELVDDYVEGTVKVDLDEVIGQDLERFLDALSFKLTSSTLLVDTSYAPVGVEDGLLVLKVSGNPALIIETRMDDMPRLPGL